MGRLTTHVLDTAHGRPGADIMIQLYRIGTDRRFLGEFVTNTDGRTDTPLLADDRFQRGTYELVFAIGDYFQQLDGTNGQKSFLDDVVIRFNLTADENYHVPLLVSPWSYSTYRGS